MPYMKFTAQVRTSSEQSSTSISDFDFASPTLVLRAVSKYLDLWIINGNFRLITLSSSQMVLKEFRNGHLRCLVVYPFIGFCYRVFQEDMMILTPLHNAVPHTQDDRMCLDHISLTLQLDVTFLPVHGRQLRNQVGGVETHGEIVVWWDHHEPKSNQGLGETVGSETLNTPWIGAYTIPSIFYVTFS